MSLEQHENNYIHHATEVATAVNELLTPMSASERISLIHSMFAERTITYSTSGGKTSAIVPFLISQSCDRSKIHLPFTLVFINTYLYGQQTLNQIARLEKRGNEQGYRLMTFQSEETLEHLSNLYPDWTSFASDDFNKVKYILKQEPLNRAFEELNTSLWGSGIMRDKQESRASARLFEVGNNGVYTFHPIADWTNQMALDYIQLHNLPINLSHYDFFKGPNQKMECGIHS